MDVNDDPKPTNKIKIWNTPINVTLDTKVWKPYILFCIGCCGLCAGLTFSFGVNLKHLPSCEEAVTAFLLLLLSQCGRCGKERLHTAAHKLHRTPSSQLWSVLQENTHTRAEYSSIMQSKTLY